MGQIEVLDWLRMEALFKPKVWFTIKEISKGLDIKGTGNNGSTDQMVRRAVSKLAHFGLIECETRGWNRSFRFVEKRVKK